MTPNLPTSTQARALMVATYQNRGIPAQIPKPIPTPIQTRRNFSKGSPYPPMLPPTSHISKPGSKSPYITLYNIPHRIHGPKQGNPFQNTKTNSQPSPLETTHSEKDNPNPQILFSNPPKFKSEPKPPNITHLKIPHRSHVPKQGNPCSKSKTKSQPLLDKMNQLEKDPPTPP